MWPVYTWNAALSHLKCISPMNSGYQSYSLRYGRIVLAIFIGLFRLADDVRAENDPLIGKPVVVKNADGRLEVFQIDGNGALRHRWQKEPNGNWSAWSDLGGAFFPGIAAAENADGQLEIFAVDRSSNILRSKHQNAPNSQDWSDWSGLGVCTNQSPVAVGKDEDGGLEVFAVDSASGGVRHMWQTNVHGGWSGWRDLGGALQPEMVVARNKEGRLELFGVDAHDKTLAHCSQIVANSKERWSEWQSLGGAILPGFTVGQNADGRLEAFAINSTNGRVNQIYQVVTNGGIGWSGWNDFGTSAKTGLAVGRNADGRLEVFGVKSNSASMLHRWQTTLEGSIQWSAWSEMGGSTQPYPALGRNQDGNLEIFAINNMDVNTLDHRRQISANSEWLEWFSMDHSPPQYTARTWQIEDGLPHNMVKAIAQTHDGYLWVGTRGGLARFDGLHFASFNATNTAEIKNSNISALCVDREGTLWIGTFGGGLVRLKDGVFSHYDTNNGLVGNELNVIYEGKNRSLWIGTTTGMSQYKDAKFTNYTAKEGLLSGVIRSICEDGSGNLWIATPAGLNRLRKGVLDSFTTTNGLPHNSVRGILLDRGGRLWIGSDRGMIWCGYNSVKFFAYDAKYGLSDSFVSAICQDHHDTLWVGTYEGLNRFREGRFFNEVNNEGVNYDQVNTLFEDREGNLWVGSMEGLSRLTPKRFVAYTRRQGLTHNNISSVREDRTGSLWLTTRGGGVDQLTGETVTSYTTANGLPHDQALCTCEDQDGSIWIGMDFDGGLLHLKNGVVTRYSWKDGLINAALRVIHEDRAGNLWIGTSRGLSCFKEGSFTNYTVKDNLSGDVIRAICEDHLGNLWFGSDGGLSCLKDGRFTNFTTSQGLPAGGVLALYEDEQEEPNLWIGTDGGGLVRYQKDRFTTYTKRQGLFSDEILEILEDDNGWLWMSCSTGIFRVRKASLDAFDQDGTKVIVSIAYGKADGMESTLCNGLAKPAGWKTRDGRLWFPTTKGLIAVVPNIEINQAPPSVFIEQLMVDKKPLFHGLLPPRDRAGAAGLDSEEDSATKAAMRIPPGRGELEFQYTALNLQTPERCRFKYKLEGIDSEWLEADTRRTVHYNNVYSGRYRFRVIACNNDGVWNETGASLDFVLLPHYWQTWWFRGLMALAVVGIVGGTSRYVTRTKMQRKLELLKQQHAVERERVRIAKDIHDELGSSLTRIMLLGQRTQEDIANPGELAVHADRIVNSARTTVQSLDEIVWAVDPKKDTLEGLVGYINQYVNQFFDGTHLRCRLEMPVNSSHLVLPAEVRHNLFLVVKEALNNVLKHSHTSEVRVRLTEAASTVTITIEDDGCGFHADKISNGRRGHGLENMRKRIENLGAEFCLITAPGQGTKLKFTIKVDSSQAGN